MSLIIKYILITYITEFQFSGFRKRLLIDKYILNVMSYYIILWTLSEQGIEKIKDSPKRFEHVKEIWTSKGIKVHAVYYIFGQYDGVNIVEAPDDASLMSALLSVESEGNARTTTLKAFTYEEAKKIIDNL